MTIDLLAERDRLLAACASHLAELQQRFGVQAIQLLPDARGDCHRLSRCCNIQPKS